MRLNVNLFVYCRCIYKTVVTTKLKCRGKRFYAFPIVISDGYAQNG